MFQIFEKQEKELRKLCFKCIKFIRITFLINAIIILRMSTFHLKCTTENLNI